MKSHSAINKSISALGRCFIVLLAMNILLFSTSLSAQDIPERPVPATAVNDFANIFTPQEYNLLEKRLVDFGDTTSNRVVIVTVNDLGGMDPAFYALSIGEKWGVGDEKFNNGVVILIKPKTEDSGGQIYISVGYGLEGALPDVTAKMIIENEIIPNFKQGEIFAGVEAALDVMLPILAGEINAGDVYEEPEVSFFGALMSFLIPIAILALLIYLPRRRSKKGGGGDGLTGTRSRHSRYIYTGGSGWSSGGSSWGSSGGGGFSGGFGGGHFGGGGAGGSW